MIVDPSAVLAILFRERGLEAFERGLSMPHRAVSLQLASSKSQLLWNLAAGTKACDNATRSFAAQVFVSSLSPKRTLLARQGFSDYGKGRHPADLNCGDCFSYALAKATGEALLFNGDDFNKTDGQPAPP